MAVFDLTDDQHEFRQVLRRFVEDRIAPRAADYDEREEYPAESFRAMCEMELPALGVPSTYGGQGADTVTQALAVEEVARA
jgi:alkylation response protein AidB-like acyl-CoA dehydrogenase